MGINYKVPIDQAKLAQLKAAFEHISWRKQNWLLVRFPGCDTDAETCELVEGVTKDQVQKWKKDDISFKAAYDLLKGGLIDWEKHIARSLEAGNALLGAMENRKLIEKSWEELESARAVSAKSAAINQALDRMVGKKENIEIAVVRMEDLLE